MPPREQLFLRIPPELKTAIQSAANEQGKTLTEWTVEALERATGLERPESIESKLASLTARIEILEQAQGKQDNEQSLNVGGLPDSKTASGQAGKPDSTPNIKALTTGGRADWKRFVRDNPGLSLDELLAIAVEVYPERQAKTMKQNITRAM